MKNELDYWQKAENDKTLKDLAWNFPEQKSKTLSIIGGHSASFTTEVKVSEYVSKTFPFLKEINNFFPDSLKSKFPPLENLKFFASSDSGSFKRSSDFRESLANSDFGLILGDLSKNSETALGISELIANSGSTPILLARDSIDLVANESLNIIMKENLFIFASLAQLQKIFRALYYPKMLLLSQPLLPVIETLHKFTLSYPVSILTFHEGHFIAAQNGKVSTIPLEKTAYSLISLWSGELAAKISVFAMFNPSSPLESILAAIVY